MKQQAAVLGVGQTEHRTRRRDVSIAGLCREAVDRALGHATSGPALQQNLVCVMEAK